jgi:hypothetical protein
VERRATRVHGRVSKDSSHSYISRSNSAESGVDTLAPASLPPLPACPLSHPYIPLACVPLSPLSPLCLFRVCLM